MSNKKEKKDFRLFHFPDWFLEEWGMYEDEEYVKMIEECSRIDCEFLKIIKELRKEQGGARHDRNDYTN